MCSFEIRNMVFKCVTILYLKRNNNFRKFLLVQRFLKTIVKHSVLSLLTYFNVECSYMGS